MIICFCDTFFSSMFQMPAFYYELLVSIYNISKYFKRSFFLVSRSEFLRWEDHEILDTKDFLSQNRYNGIQVQEGERNNWHHRPIFRSSHKFKGSI